MGVTGENTHPPADFCQNDALFTSFSGMFCQSIGFGCAFFNTNPLAPSSVFFLVCRRGDGC